MAQQDMSSIGDGLTDIRFDYRKWGIYTAFVTVLASIAFSTHFFTVIGINKDLIAVGNHVFLKYLFIIVAVERAAAAYVGRSRTEKKADWPMRINRLNEILSKENLPIQVLKQVYSRESELVKQLREANVTVYIHDLKQTPPPTADDYIGYLTSVKHTYQFQGARFSSITNRQVTRMVFFLGIGLAAIGLSLFQDLLHGIDLPTLMEQQIKDGQLSQTGLTIQALLLRFSDIVITGGLLGGGSAGLNTAASKISDFINKS